MSFSCSCSKALTRLCRLTAVFICPYMSFPALTPMSTWLSVGYLSLLGQARLIMPCFYVLGCKNWGMDVDIGRVLKQMRVTLIILIGL